MNVKTERLEKDLRHSLTHSGRRALRVMASVVAVAFVVETTIMLALRSLGHEPVSLAAVFFDAAILSTLIAPPIYFLVLRPIQREHAMLLRAEAYSEAAAHLASTDPLTGVLNRRGILDRLHEGLAEAQRYARPMSVALFDLDGFKKINDSFGHGVGDQVLKEVCAVLVGSLRVPDKLGRWGGDEFILVLPDTDLEESYPVIERLRQLVSEMEFDLRGGVTRLGASVGATEYAPPESVEQLLARTDEALYEAKAEGRDRVVSVTASGVSV